MTTRRWWYAMCAAFLSSILMGVVSIQVSAHAQAEAERRIEAQQRAQAAAWCIFLVPLGDRQRAAHFTKPDDILVAQAVEALRAAYHC